MPDNPALRALAMLLRAAMFDSCMLELAMDSGAHGQIYPTRSTADTHLFHSEGFEVYSRNRSCRAGLLPETARPSLRRRSFSTRTVVDLKIYSSLNTFQVQQATEQTYRSKSSSGSLSTDSASDTISAAFRLETSTGRWMIMSLLGMLSRLLCWYGTKE